MRKFRILMFLLGIGILMSGCSGSNVGKTGGNNGMLTKGEAGNMDYNNAILREVEYSWSSGSMARAAFFIKVNEKEIVKADYYPENADISDFEMHHKENESISENEWKDITEAVKILYPVLKEHKSSGVGSGIITGLMENQILDGGDSFSFTLTWEVDGELISKTYYEPAYERFRVLSTLLTELADPIGREIPVYSEPELTGVWLSMGKKAGRDRYSFQCKADPDVEGEYYFFCYYPENGKEVRNPNSRVDEASWMKIHDGIKALGLEEKETAGNTKKNTLILYYSNGSQREVYLEKDNAEAVKTIFLDIIGAEGKAAKTIGSILFGRFGERK